MLARRLTTILPAMTLTEAIETTRIHRVAGLTGDRTALVTTRPCRAPHHTISDAGLIGGGHVPMPGEVSLAHNGVRFLDEWPECRRYVPEVWRPPLEGESRIQTIARTSSISYRWQALRCKRSMFSAKGDEGLSSSCTLLEDRYRSKSVG
jgi:magnesium chelatase family protein